MHYVGGSDAASESVHQFLPDCAGTRLCGGCYGSHPRRAHHPCGRASAYAGDNPFSRVAPDEIRYEITVDDPITSVPKRARRAKAWMKTSIRCGVSRPEHGLEEEPAGGPAADRGARPTSFRECVRF